MYQKKHQHQRVPWIQKAKQYLNKVDLQVLQEEEDAEMSVWFERLGDNLVKHEPLGVGVLQQAARGLTEIVDHPFQRFPLSRVFDCIQIHSTWQWYLGKLYNSFYLTILNFVFFV